MPFNLSTVSDLKISQSSSGLGILVKGWLRQISAKEPFVGLWGCLAVWLWVVASCLLPGLAHSSRDEAPTPTSWACPASAGKWEGIEFLLPCH